MVFRVPFKPIALGAVSFIAGFIFLRLPEHYGFTVFSAKAEYGVETVIPDDDRKKLQYASVMKYGIPSHDTVRRKRNFVLSYDRRKKVPYWVMEHLTRENFEGEICSTRFRFFEDNSVHEYFRSSSKDYSKSGYDRGHLAAAGNYNKAEDTLDTFVMSNIAPQNKHFNQNIWQNLELRVRDLVKKYGSVYVCSGPLFIPRVISADEEHLVSDLDKDGAAQESNNEDNNVKQRKFIIYEVIGNNNVGVPTHFFKVIVCEKENEEYDLESYIIPNQKINKKKTLDSFLVPRDAIERAAGFLLFHHLPVEVFSYINGQKNKRFLKSSL